VSRPRRGRMPRATHSPVAGATPSTAESSPPQPSEPLSAAATRTPRVRADDPQFPPDVPRAVLCQVPQRHPRVPSALDDHVQRLAVVEPRVGDAPRRHRPQDRQPPILALRHIPPRARRAHELVEHPSPRPVVLQLFRRHRLPLISRPHEAPVPGRNHQPHRYVRLPINDDLPTPRRTFKVSRRPSPTTSPSRQCSNGPVRSRRSVRTDAWGRMIPESG
jgi:hypothetical protein